MYLPVKSRDAENIKLPAGIDPIIGWLSHILLKPYTPQRLFYSYHWPMVFFMLNKAHAAHDGHDWKSSNSFDSNTINFFSFHGW